MEKLEMLKMFLESKPKSELTLTDKRLFENNTKNDILQDIVGKHIEQIEYHKNIFLGESVKKGNGILYYESTEDGSFIFTEEVFEEFVNERLSYTIEYLTNKLVNGTVSVNSTCPFTNLVNQWRIEVYQDVIRTYKIFLVYNG